MNKYLLNELIEASYHDNSLDPQHVDQIAEKLSRKQLKEYLYALKARERQTTVLVSYANDRGEQMLQDSLKSLFPGKKMKSAVNPSLLLGIRITDNDLVYDLSLNSTLEQIQTYAKEIEE